KIKISPEAVDPDDVETLEDLVLAAVNEAMKNADEASSAAMQHPLSFLSELLDHLVEGSLCAKRETAVLFTGRCPEYRPWLKRKRQYRHCLYL
ncbi:MAG: YbaB/EbfC family nucleoid-associated protein, partial [Erysipelotrichaceae bacterium]|nr:YbaB/EbfC family nucleoid-associated protein [Erysipelotrichaceae bacterium]